MILAFLLGLFLGTLLGALALALGVAAADRTEPEPSSERARMKARLSLLVLLLALGCSGDGPSAPLRTETYTLSSAPWPIRHAGTLELRYSAENRGTVWYRIERPWTTDLGSFELRGHDDIELAFRSGTRRTGDFDYHGSRLTLNDGTRWKRVR